MQAITRISAVVATVAALSSANAFATETTLFQTADLNDYGMSEPGGYFLDSTRAIGTTFQLSSAADITSIGGYFSNFSDGSIYAALVQVSGLNGTPMGDLSTSSLAHVVFSPVGGEQSAALSLHLNAGSYALVFGSGLFGADGSSALVSGQGTTGAPSLFSGDGVTWTSFDGNDVRMFVNGVSAVPEPGEWALMLAGIGALGAVSRRRRLPV